MLKNTLNEYGSITKLLHWLMAGLFIGMYLVAYTMINIQKSDFRLSLYDLHKATGLLLFALFALRLTWRRSNPQPDMPAGIAKFQHRAAQFTIVLLYILMFAMPVSGFLTSTLSGHDITFYHLFSISPLANNDAAADFFSLAHEWLSYILLGIFSLHVSASLFHHFYLKDDILRRIWIRKR